MTRRELFEGLISTAALLPFGIGAVVRNAFAAELISESDPTASALNYKHDAKKVPDSAKPAKDGIDGKKQNCRNCQLYKKTGKQKGKEVGECQLFQNKLVMGDGWCSSWMKKM